MDPGTGLTILGSAIGGAKIIERILGPTADYIGSGLSEWTAKRVQNTAYIFQKASEKLGKKIDEPGSVPPRVLKEILSEGSYCDDALVAEYFGGVLASSRTCESRDDRAASYLKLTSELSTYQIRFHYVSCFTCRMLFKGSGLRPSFADDLEKMWIFLPDSYLGIVMDFTEEEPIDNIFQHCFLGLERHGLMFFSHYGTVEHINKFNKRLGWCEVSEGGVCLKPASFGIEYWLWAVGLGAFNRSNFLDNDLEMPSLPNISIPETAKKLVDEG